MTPEEILMELIRFPSVVGQPNTAITSWIAQYLETLGVEARILPGPEGDRANLFATIGPRGVSGLVLSGHMDVVPAEEPQWSADPFWLRRVIEASFSQRRKKLLNSLRGSHIVPHGVEAAHLLEAGIDPNRRAETLSLEEFVRLADALSALLPNDSN